MIIAFNIFIGYTAHQGRAWGALKLSAPLFSSLSMTGIVAGYIFSYLFEKKKPNKQIIFGAILILIASILSFFEKDIMLLHEKRKKRKEEQQKI